MEKAKRIVYGSQLMAESGKSVGYFVTAFTVTDKADKLKYLDLAIAAYAVLRTDIEFCAEESVFHFTRGEATRKAVETGRVNENGKRISQEKIELFKLVAKIDDDLCKWRAYLAKGKSVSD